MEHFDWIQRHAERTPEKLALVDAHTGRELTYAQLNRRANRGASFLQDTLGIQPGDRVSILAKNSSDYYEVLFACSKMGAILNTLNWRLTVPELAFILNDCAPRVLIYEPEFAAAVDALRPQIEAEFYIVMGDEAPEGEWTYESALVAGAPEGVAAPRLNYADTWTIPTPPAPPVAPRGPKSPTATSSTTPSASARPSI
jgi:fatty-acyl-CoA synthase